MDKLDVIESRIVELQKQLTEQKEMKKKLKQEEGTLISRPPGLEVRKEFRIGDIIMKDDPPPRLEFTPYIYTFYRIKKQSSCKILLVELYVVRHYVIDALGRPYIDFEIVADEMINSNYYYSYWEHNYTPFSKYKEYNKNEIYPANRGYGGSMPRDCIYKK